MMRQAAVRTNGRFTSVETGVRSYSAGNEEMEGVGADVMKRTRFDVAKVLFCGDKNRADRHTQGTRRHTVGIYILSEANLSFFIVARTLLHTCHVFRPSKVYANRS